MDAVREPEYGARPADVWASDAELAGRALEFIRVYADECHHGKEEGLLFPALEQGGLPADAEPLTVMLQEHVQSRELEAEMASGLDGLREGDPAAGAAFAEATVRYGALLRDHIHKENGHLFPLAEQTLSPEAKADLEQQFERIDAVEVGAETIARHEAFLQEMLGQVSEAAG